MKTPVTVTVTGAAGQIGYSLLFRIAKGDLFGPDVPVNLHLLEVPVEPVMKALEGVVMELQDCAFPLLRKLVATSDPDAGFAGANWCLLVGAAPRKAGMERKDLLGTNGRIFVGQGRAIAKNAAPDVRVLVVGNPCNTNAWICRQAARDVPADRFFAMTALDENRARTQLALKTGRSVRDVSFLAIWGNHSSTMYPDFHNTRIGGRPAVDVVGDEGWFKDTFIPTVQQRGAAIIKARGASSAASAANAAIDTVRRLTTPTHPDDCFSVAVTSDGAYGIEPGLMFSYPIRSDGSQWSVVPGVSLTDYARQKIAATEAELKEERALVADLLA